MTKPTNPAAALPIVQNPYLELAIQAMMDAASPPVVALMQQMTDMGDDPALLANAQCNAYVRLLCAAASVCVVSLGSDRDKLVDGMQRYLAEGVDHLLANREKIAAEASKPQVAS
jgi:hypothetical protein